MQKGHVRSWQGVGFSGEGYGKLLAISWWEASYEAPIYLISNLSELEQILTTYKLRFRIKTLFSYCKRRGFGLQGSCF